MLTEGGASHRDTVTESCSKAKRRIDKAKALGDGGYRTVFLELRRKRRRQHNPDPGSEPGVPTPDPVWWTAR